MKNKHFNELSEDFRKNTNKIKKYRKELLKSNSPEEQSRIINQIDSIAKEMEKNQKQATKVSKFTSKEKKRRL